MQCCGTRINRSYPLCGKHLILSEITLELRNTRPGSQPSRLHAGHDLVDLSLFNQGGAKNYEFFFSIWKHVIRNIKNGW